MIGATTLHGLLMQASSVPLVGGYGYLYNWYAASDANFAPTDWKVASQLDYSTLKSFLGGNIGGRLKERGGDHWLTPNAIYDPDSGFNSLGGGLRNLNGGFQAIKSYNTYILVDSTTATTCPYFRHIYQGLTDINFNNLNKKIGGSVRVLYDGTGTPPSTITDIDGNAYDVVQIGTQYWTVQNWKCTKLNNGISIPNVTDDTEWANLGSGLGLDPRYGYLYNWFVVDGNGANLINGLHVPTNTEQRLLRTYVGSTTGGGRLKEVGTTSWIHPNTGAILDEFNFTALAGGSRNSANGGYQGKGSAGYFWTTSEDSTSHAEVFRFSYSTGFYYYSSLPKTNGFSVRCMRELTAQEQIDFADGDIVEVVTDFDYNSYNVIRIGTQGWTNVNLRTGHYLNGDEIDGTLHTNQEWVDSSIALSCIFGDNTLDNPNGRCAYGNDPGNV